MNYEQWYGEVQAPTFGATEQPQTQGEQPTNWLAILLALGLAGGAAYLAAKGTGNPGTGVASAPGTAGTGDCGCTGR